MVRPRIQLERLSGELSRDHYYLHSKSIVSKKVKEVSVLTGADVLFVGFSPRGVPTIHLGDNSNFMEIMRKFAKVSYNDQEKRRHDNIQTLKANYQKEKGYNIEVEKLFDAWKLKKLEEMREEMRKLNKDLNRVLHKKRFLENPEKVYSIEMLNEIEKTLQKSLERIRKRKEEIIMSAQKTADEFAESALKSFEEYIPEMLSGSDDMVAYANILMSGNEASTSKAQQW
ncbi:hypothetical protein vseg_004683 [Gypsophila vaccaria]